MKCVVESLITGERKCWELWWWCLNSNYIDHVYNELFWKNGLKVHSVVWRRNLNQIFIGWCLMSDQTTLKNSLHFSDWINKLTLKDNTILCCFTLLICDGLCHLSSVKRCSGDLIFLWKQLVYSVMEQINISEFVLLPYLYWT